MNKQQYKAILAVYTKVKDSEGTQSRSAGGYHYNLVDVMLSAGFDVRGMDNRELIGNPSRLKVIHQNFMLWLLDVKWLLKGVVNG